MSDVPASHNDALSAAFDALIGAPNRDAAARIVSDHPLLRDPLVVGLMYRMAYQATARGDTDAANTLYEQAALLCGPSWAGGPDVVGSLATIWTSPAYTPDKQTWLNRVYQATRPVVANDMDGADAMVYRRTHELASDLLLSAYQATGEVVRLEESVATQRLAVKATPQTSVDLPHRLSDLSGLLAKLYRATGNQPLLDEAVTTERTALAATPPTSNRLPRHQNNLANRLGELYKATGDLPLLDEAIANLRSALRATLETSADWPLQLNNLATRLDDLHWATGEIAPLIEAVELQRRATAAISSTDDSYSEYLHNLSGFLADLYEATGERALIDEAVEIQRSAVSATVSDSTRLADRLNGLALRLDTLYRAVGDLDILTEAVTTQRRAVEKTPDTSIDLPEHLNNLANRLHALYRITGDRMVLDEALRTQRRAVALTSGSDARLSVHLNNLAEDLADMAAILGDRALLDEAVTTQRHAVEMTPRTHSEFPRHLINLAHRLADLYGVSEEPGLLDEAWSIMSEAESTSPGMSMSVAATRGGLARMRGDAKRAAAELARAHGAFDHEIARLRRRQDLKGLRDLAHRVDGLLGDLVSTQVLNGELAQAVSLIERDRVWLPAPDAARHGDELTRTLVPTAWVIPSRWDTAIIVTRTEGRSFEHAAVAVTRDEIGATVMDAINAARRRDYEAIDRSVELLVQVASSVANVFPDASEMLVVPLGVASMLPYNAATSVRGRPLVNETAITIAPSLAWAHQATRKRPLHAGHLGVFHPGRPPTLDLDLDRNAFMRLVGQNVLDLPTAEDVFAELRTEMAVAHFSCHGAYNQLKPFDSDLELETPLSLNALLGHEPMPWLVNLSACETGIPDLGAGEQLVSFPTGFLLGGAAHVVATLWPVGNRQATVINDHLYTLTARGTHPARALQQAIQAMRDAADEGPRESFQRRPVADNDQTRSAAKFELDPGHPFWWSPFTHFGSPW